jgi:hypothetical protein
MIHQQYKYKFFKQSSSSEITYKDTVEFHLTLLGNTDYIFFLCTMENYEPVRFRIIDTDNDLLIYDNKLQEYIDNMKLKLKDTRNFIIKAEVLIKNSLTNKFQTGCVGLYIQCHRK